MRRIRTSLLLAVLSSIGYAQLTTAQKQFDFQSLAGLFAKRYGPYEWKRDVIGFDLMKTAPWMDRISTTTNDLDFYEVLVEYVASLQDTHTTYNLPASFTATLGIDADVYDGKVLIDYIDRTALPEAQYPFQIGDEVTAVDGTPIQDLITRFSVYGMQANVSATRRMAVDRILTRRQQFMPYAAQIGDTAAVAIQRRNGGLATYAIGWQKSGLAVSQLGPVPSPPGRPGRGRRMALAGSTEAAGPDPLVELQTSIAPNVLGVFSIPTQSPVFYPPPGFKTRLGKSTDFFISGTFPSGNYNIGFIRIPTYSVSDTAAALSQFAQEIAYFNANTDGLIVDQMRNNGGDLCFGENIVSYLAPNGFRTLGHEIRATLDFLQLLQTSIDSARQSGAPQQQIDQYQSIFNAISAAYYANRGRTEAVPLCTPSFHIAAATDNTGKVLAYAKPFIVLDDELTYSTAEAVAAIVQDNRLGQLVGSRTNGAGGSTGLSLALWPVGVYSEGSTGVTLTLMARSNVVATGDYPPTRYIENVGVRPDVAVEYMTAGNLLQQGQPYVAAITAALVKQIQAGRGN